MLITPVRENFGLLKSIQHEESELVEKLEQWTRRRYEELLPVFYQRLANGMIRECADFALPRTRLRGFQQPARVN